jgi:hypothetical protein
MFLLLCRYNVDWAGGYHGDVAIQDDFMTTSRWVIFLSFFLFFVEVGREETDDCCLLPVDST